MRDVWVTREKNGGVRIISMRNVGIREARKLLIDELKAQSSENLTRADLSRGGRRDVALARARVHLSQCQAEIERYNRMKATMNARTALERRGYAVPCSERAGETREAMASPTIIGYAAVFYRAGDPGSEFDLDSFTVERINRTAFETMQKDDVRALFNHSPDNILGRNKAGTLQLTVDNRGLRYRIDTQGYRLDIVGAIRRGDVTGSSFAFEITDQRLTPGRDKTIREILGVRLHDVGPVTYPAYTSTSVKVMT